MARSTPSNLLPAASGSAASDAAAASNKATANTPVDEGIDTARPRCEGLATIFPAT
jgi:hypothetical protein